VGSLGGDEPSLEHLVGRRGATCWVARQDKLWPGHLVGGAAQVLRMFSFLFFNFNATSSFLLSWNLINEH
jgi:hypothetical protein